MNEQRAAVEKTMLESGFEPNIPPAITRARAGSLLMTVAGPIIYMVYFAVGYMLAEAGCRMDILQGELFGFPALSAVLLGLTALTLLALLAVAVVQYFRFRRARRNVVAPNAAGVIEENARDLPFLLAVGAGLALLFAWVTIATGAPILVLEPCAWW